MKRFKFKLQPLLNYRKYLERLAQQNTAKAQMDIKNCEDNIQALKHTRDHHADKMENIVEKGVRASDFKQYHTYLDAVEISIEDEKKKKIELKKILKDKLLELKKKSVDKKAMDLYRDKLKATYAQEVIKIEQKEQDEISSLKTARKISNETA